MVTITMTEAEYRILKVLLEEADEARGDMVCNDPIDEETNLFTKDERIEISTSVCGKENADELDGFLFNCDVSAHLLNVVRANAVTEGGDKYEEP